MRCKGTITVLQFLSEHFVYRTPIHRHSCICGYFPHTCMFIGLLVWSLTWLIFLNYAHKTHKAGGKVQAVPDSLLCLPSCVNSFWILCPLWGPLCQPCHSCGISSWLLCLCFPIFPILTAVWEVDKDFRSSGASKAKKRCKACIKLSYVMENLIPRSPRSCVVLCKCSVMRRTLKRVQWRSVTRDIL